MARNFTRVYQYSAEFRADPFCRPDWKISRWEGYQTLPYAVSTISRDTLETEGVRELPAADVARIWPHGAMGVLHLQVQRAFVVPQGAPGNANRFAVIIALVKVSGRN